MLILNFTKMNKLLSILLASSLLLFAGCTDLEEELNSALTKEDAVAQDILNACSALSAAYDVLRPFQSQAGTWSLQAHSSDEIAGPTRGTDWFDGGAWQAMHTHSWTASHAHVGQAWNDILGGLFQATSALEFNPSPEERAQALYFQAYYTYLAVDLFGKVPFREPGEDLTQAPAVLSRTEAIEKVIALAEEALTNLPDLRYVNTSGCQYTNKNACRALLSKAYLNRAVFAATDANGGAQAGPYTFSQSDMSKVVQYTDQIINSGTYSLETNYFDNFAPDNTTESSELIWGYLNTNASAGDIHTRWFMTLHYNQVPSGWNGFVTLADFYNSFEDQDVRKEAEIPSIQAGGGGYNAGFLAGLQTDASGNPLKDRLGNDLAFSAGFSITNSNEIQGIRAIKYIPDFVNPAGPANNDYVVFRYADVLMMKAEALLRSGNAAGALTIVNQIRTLRGASALSSLDEEGLLAERGRELYWEGWRRNDQIRFNKFLQAWAEKPAGNATKLLFPIPSLALATNPNLAQNPGY